MPALSRLPNCHPSDTAKCRVVTVTSLDWDRHRLACVGLDRASIGLPLTECQRWPLVDRTCLSRATEDQYEYQYSDLQPV